MVVTVILGFMRAPSMVAVAVVIFVAHRERTMIEACYASNQTMVDLEAGLQARLPSFAANPRRHFATSVVFASRVLIARARQTALPSTPSIDAI
jgi:hypothetical protein